MPAQLRTAAMRCGHTDTEASRRLAGLIVDGGRPLTVPPRSERPRLLDEDRACDGGVERLVELPGVACGEHQAAGLREGAEPARFDVERHEIDGRPFTIGTAADRRRDVFRRHAPLLERLLAWTIRIVVPAHLEGAAQDLQKVAWGQLASPLKEPVLTELRWYFERCRRAFATDRYAVLYRCWAAGRRASADDRFVVSRGEGVGVRRREDRANRLW